MPSRVFYSGRDKEHRLVVTVDRDVNAGDAVSFLVEGEYLEDRHTFVADAFSAEGIAKILCETFGYEVERINAYQIKRSE